MELTHLQIEGIQRILIVLGQKAHPMLAYRVTLLNGVFRDYIKAIVAARKPAVEFQMFTKKHSDLCKECGELVQTNMSDPLQQTVAANYDIRDVEKYTKGIKALEIEYADAIIKEGERQESLVQLLESTVDLELEHKIKYSWCKELLSGNHMTRLLECGILEMDEEPVDPDESKGDASEEVEK